VTHRKTLQLRSPDETADAAPAIKKKGRGWEISEKRLDALHDRARDFGCPNLGMAIMLDEEGADPALATRRDKSLEAVGIRVMRIAAADVLADMDGVLARITAEMRARIADKKTKAREHAAANPNQHYSRGRR
jgi:very-short-patch-repair endonuclease